MLEKTRKEAAKELRKVIHSRYPDFIQASEAVAALQVPPSYCYYYYYYYGYYYSVDTRISFKPPKPWRPSRSRLPTAAAATTTTLLLYYYYYYYYYYGYYYYGYYD